MDPIRKRALLFVFVRYLLLGVVPRAPPNFFLSRLVMSFEKSIHKILFSVRLLNGS